MCGNNILQSFSGRGGHAGCCRQPDTWVIHSLHEPYLSQTPAWSDLLRALASLMTAFVIPWNEYEDWQRRWWGGGGGVVYPYHDIP